MEIINYSPELADHFDAINRHCIVKYFVMEDRDNLVLRNPTERIIITHCLTGVFDDGLNDSICEFGALEMI